MFCTARFGLLDPYLPEPCVSSPCDRWKRSQAPFPLWHDSAVEFLNFLLILTAGYLLLRRPERERLAFGLLVTSCLLMATLFLIGARGSILPGLNY